MGERVIILLFAKSDKIKKLSLLNGKIEVFNYFQEKAFNISKPYRKPTQVNKFSKLR